LEVFFGQYRPGVHNVSKKEKNMKKVLSVIAVSAFVLTAGVALAGGPGKKMDAGCPEACQQQIDDLNSSQAQQNEQLGAHGKTLENHEGRITTLEKDLYDPWYGRIGVKATTMSQDINDGVVIADVDSDLGWGGALAFGRQFGDFRAELELAHQIADLDDNATLVPALTNAELNVTTVMVNAYYEIPVADAFAVYAMAGLGFAKYDLDDNGSIFDESSNAFAYKAGLGLTYNIDANMAADLGYEYLGIADNGAADDINGHNVVASFRYKF
jgi:opacity protein-like surface antigen